MVDPTGVGLIRVTEILAGLRAWGEIQGVPGPQLDVILDAARKGLEEQPDRPRPPPPPVIP